MLLLTIVEIMTRFFLKLMIGLKSLMMKKIEESLLKSSLTILATTLSPQLTFGSKDIKITILHTNDMHSHIEPFKTGRK